MSYQYISMFITQYLYLYNVSKMLHFGTSIILNMMDGLSNKIVTAVLLNYLKKYQQELRVIFELQKEMT